jgi:AcrR family transcriptional regulator
MHRNTLSPTKLRSFVKVVDTAQFLFDRVGIEHTTMKEIAEESGLSRFTVYNLFKNKDEIVISVVINCLEDMYSAVEPVDPNGNLYDEMYKYFHSLIDMYLEKDYALRMLIAYYREYSDKQDIEHIMDSGGTEINKHRTAVEELYKNSSSTEEEMKELRDKFYIVYNFTIGLGMRYSSRKSVFIGNDLESDTAKLHKGLDHLLDIWK